MSEMITSEQSWETLEFAHSLVDMAERGMLPHGMARAARLLVRQAVIMQADQEGRKQFAENPPSLKPGLHVGCGANILKDFTNLDIFPNEGVDVVCDAREGLPFTDGQFDLVFSEHMLEHVDYPISTKLVLRETVRVTKPGGLIIVGVPDSSIPIRAYTSGDEEYFTELRDRWYGRRDQLQHYQYPVDLVRLVMADEDDDKIYTPHLWAFDETQLAGLMEEAGLVAVSPWDIDPSISLPKRHWGSVYLQGNKPIKGEVK